MSLTRKMLEALGIDEKAAEQIIEAHTEVTSALKKERDGYKASADTLESVQKELNDLKEKHKEDWEGKYNSVKTEFENFKTEQAEKSTLAAKKAAYAKMVESTGIIDKKLISLISNMADFSKIELDGENLKNFEDYAKSIGEEYADYISSAKEKGADVEKTSKPGSATQLDELPMEEYIKARSGK